MSYGRITPDMLRHMARLVETGCADGEYRIEHAHEDDFDYTGIERGSSTRYRSELDRYVFEFRVSPSAPSVRNASDRRQYVRSVELPPEPAPIVIVTPAPAPIDYRPAVELFVKIVQVIVRAWTMDDSKIRFGMLEL